MENTLERGQKPDLEQKRDQLIVEMEEIALRLEQEQERINLMDSGKYPLDHYPTFVALKSELKKKEDEIFALNEELESEGNVRTLPEVKTAEAIVRERFEAGNKFEKRNPGKQLEDVNEEIAELRKKIDAKKTNMAFGAEAEITSMEYQLRLLLKRAANIEAGLAMHEDILKKAA